MNNRYWGNRRGCSYPIKKRRNDTVDQPPRDHHRDLRSPSLQRAGENSRYLNDQYEINQYSVTNNSKPVNSMEERPNKPKGTEKPVFPYRTNDQNTMLFNGAIKHSDHLNSYHLDRAGTSVPNGGPYSQPDDDDVKDFNVVPMNINGRVRNDRFRSSSFKNRRNDTVDQPRGEYHREHRSPSLQRAGENSRSLNDQYEVPQYSVRNNSKPMNSMEERPNRAGTSVPNGGPYSPPDDHDVKDSNIVRMNMNNRVRNDRFRDKRRTRDRPWDDRKDFIPRGRNQRPWRGYVVEEQQIEDRIFQSVAIADYYVQEAISDGDAAINIHSGTEKLLSLHKKFISQRKLIDDGRTLEQREVVNENIPFNFIEEQSGECECEEEQKKSGIHHHIFPKLAIPRCDQYSNNADIVHHYRLLITPETNFVTRDPTTIYYDGKDYVFEGYSIFSHVRLEEIPNYTFTRNYIDYTVKLIPVNHIPEGFCIKDLDLVSDYLFDDIMELQEWKRLSSEKKCCSRFHFMPRFVHQTQDLTVENGKVVWELLSMAEIIQYLHDSIRPFTESEIVKYWKDEDWKEFGREKHGAIISNLKNKPRSIRVDDVLTAGMDENETYPDVVHVTPKYKEGTKFDMKEYGNLCAKLTKAKRAVKSRAVPRNEDQQLVWNLQRKIQNLKDIRGATKWLDIAFSSRQYYNTGICWDICQHASYLPALTNYLHIMLCTSILEHNMNYKFKDKSLLKVALTHPSHMDTASFSHFIWNMLQNLGKQYPHYERKRRGPPKIGAKKKGVIYMTHLMANLYQKEEVTSLCRHNERLEFLGDAILDYLTSLHLFLMFPEKGPGKLTAFRSGIVQTENLSELAKKIGLEQYILLQHRVAEVNKTENYLGNALEAVFGAVYLDGGLIAVDNLLSFILFVEDEPGTNTNLCKVWNFLKKHPLQEDMQTDRHLIEKSDLLKKFVLLENQIGVEFRHIRILAKAFTQSVHGLYDQKLTGGNYERMEFLGDAILKYTSSDYLYKHFPTHQEGHLTLLRSALVNSRCLAQAARELGLNNFIIYKSYKEASTMKEKVCSDVFEALLGALHIEKGVAKGIVYCQKFVEVCILSRLKEFIINQEWLDSKSQLQQCCFSLRDPADPMKDGKDYFHPVYKRLKHVEENGVFYFKVGVYVNGKKLGVGEGRNTKEAEKEAAKQALCNNYFEQYAEQKRIIFRKFGHQKGADYESCSDDDEQGIRIPQRRFSTSDDDDSDESDDAGANEDDGVKTETKPDEKGDAKTEETSEATRITRRNRGKQKKRLKVRESIPKVKKPASTKSRRKAGPHSKDSIRNRREGSLSSERSLASCMTNRLSEGSRKSSSKQTRSADSDRKQQNHVSLEQWMSDKKGESSTRKNGQDSSCSAGSGLGSDAVSSDEYEVLEDLESSSDDDDDAEYIMISSEEFDTDYNDETTKTKTTVKSDLKDETSADPTKVKVEDVETKAVAEEVTPGCFDESSSDSSFSSGLEEVDVWLEEVKPDESRN